LVRGVADDPAACDWGWVAPTPPVAEVAAGDAVAVAVTVATAAAGDPLLRWEMTYAAPTARARVAAPAAIGTALLRRRAG